MVSNPRVPPLAVASIRAFIEGYPQGGRVARHSHGMDQLALIAGSAAVIETDAVYLVHPLLKALWLPTGVEHSVYSPRPFTLHSLYFPTDSLRASREPEVLGLDNLTRELILFLCAAPRPTQRDGRHENALALLAQLLPLAKAESLSLPRPRSPRARKLADHFATHPHDGRALEIVVAAVGGASLRTFERLFVEETALSLAAWRRQSRMLASLSFLAEGKSMAEVAHAVGYDSPAAFSTAFKQCFGVSPSNYLSE